MNDFVCDRFVCDRFAGWARKCGWRGWRGRCAVAVVKHAREGFILAATLWALVALAVLAAYIDRVTATNVETAWQSKLLLEGELDRRSTEATLLYLLGTSRRSHHGLILEPEPAPQRIRDTTNREDPQGSGVLELAGERYAGIGDAGFSLQDETGLVSVNVPTAPAFQAVLQSLGVPEVDVARLVPRIRDYTDLDDDLRLDGAEQFDYARAGRPAPSNWMLLTTSELDRVLGFDGLLDPAQWQRLRAMTTPRLTGVVNFNVMPVEVATALLGIDAAALTPLLEERAEKPIWNVDRVLDLTGQLAPVDPERVIGTPSVYLRLSTWYRGGGPRTVVGIYLTPSSIIAPWRKEYRYSEPNDPEGPHREAPTTLLADRPDEPV